MAPKPSKIELRDDQKEELVGLVARVRKESAIGDFGAGYLVLPKDELPEAISAPLREKCPGAVAMVSDVCPGLTALAINLRRWEPKVSAIDQEPFAVAIVDSDAHDVGWFLHHGDWTDRTVVVADSDAWSDAKGSSLSDFLILEGSPPSDAGPLSDLEGRSDRPASRGAWKCMYDMLDESS